VKKAAFFGCGSFTSDKGNLTVAVVLRGHIDDLDGGSHIENVYVGVE
jgi:hypothetical protein